MDKYEYKVRSEEIKTLISQGKYDEAVKIADSIDWRRVKSVMMLCTISDLYKINRRYEDSRDILLLAYERHTGGRLIVYSLCELSIKLGEYVQALEYYKEFVQLAPKDSGRYVLQYKLYEAQEVSLEERIEVLEELKKRDYREKWAYELAYLYHRVGLASKCVEECDEMFLWFGEGRHVLKGLELKMLHGPLSPEQQEKYDQMKQTGGFITPDYVADQEAIREKVETQAEEEDEEEEDEDDEFSLQENILSENTQEIPVKDELDIQVKTIDISQYNTLNLQKELAESMKEFLEEHKTREMPVAEARDLMQTQVYEPVKGLDSQTGGMDIETKEEKRERKEVKEQKPVAMDNNINLDRETGEIRVFANTGKNEEEDYSEQPIQAEQPMQVTQAQAQPAQVLTQPLPKVDKAPASNGSEEVFFGNTEEVNIQDVVMELAEKSGVRTLFTPINEQVQMPLVQEEEIQRMPIAQNDTVPEASPNPAISNTGIIRTFLKPSGYDNLLSQEYDGQISLVIPEQEKIEKQITGQLSIEDIMAEWEKMKQDNERKRMEDIRKRVQQQTDTLFADFDESTKTGLLEELEKAMVTAAMKEEKIKAAKELPKVVKMASMNRKAQEEEAGFGDDGWEDLQDIGEGQEETAGPGLPGKESGAIEETAIKEEVPPTPAGPGMAGRELKKEGKRKIRRRPPELEKPAEPGTEEPENDEEGQVKEKPVKEKAIKAKPIKDKALKGEEPEDSPEEEREEVIQTDQEEAAETIEENDSKFTAREMTTPEKEQFAPFIHHRRTRKQIVEAIDNISMASYTGNVIITGEEGTGTLELAKLLVKEIQLSDRNFSGKMAKISGATLNKKDVGATLNKLTGGALIIETAASLRRATVEQLLKELNQEEKGIIILLEDTKPKINELLVKNPELKTAFNLRVDVEALDDHTLVKYAKKYALGQEYAIDELGILALHTRIADMQTSDHEVSLAEIEELVDEAIYYADRKTPKHFFDVLLGKRYDEEDMIVLREDDFMHY